VKNHEACIIETFEIKHHAKDMKANVDMVDVDTLK